MPAVDVDTAIFEDLFSIWEGAVELQWEPASTCPCENPGTHQPEWGCTKCNGTGVLYASAQTIKALFRSQDRWLTFRREGEFDHGEAQLSTALSAKPGYIYRRVRDRYTTLTAIGDVAEGRVFVPSAQARPFIFANVQRAWRVALQSMSEEQMLVTNPVQT